MVGLHVSLMRTVWNGCVCTHSGTSMLAHLVVVLGWLFQSVEVVMGADTPNTSKLLAPTANSFGDVTGGSAKLSMQPVAPAGIPLNVMPALMSFVPGPPVRAIKIPGSLDSGDSWLKVTATSGNWIVQERLEPPVVGRGETRDGAARRRGMRGVKYMIGFLFFLTG
jgi:hypothetical protein